MTQDWAQHFFFFSFLYIEEIQQKATACLTAIAKEDFRGASSSGRSTGRSVYMQRCSSLRVIGLGFCTWSFATNYALVLSMF
jgi:hypothetical protein